MFKNYLKLAWRNLAKNKTFSMINIFGLSIGLTCCMLISIYIANEMSYDIHHNNGDRVFQLGTDFLIEGESKLAANTSGAVGRLMQQEFPEIEKTARLMRLWRDDKTLFQYERNGSMQSFYETKGYIADSSFFQVITFPFIAGNSATALTEPNTVVVSQEIAQKMFGNEPAVGKVVRISSSTHGDHDYKITGVYTPPPTPSHIDARFIVSFGGGNANSFANNNPSLVNNNMFYTYLLLKEGANAKTLQARFPAFINTHMGEQLKGMGKQRRHFLTPIKDVYLNAGIEDNVIPGGSKTSLYILASIALLTLFIACINFMNLSTSSSAKRATEVGVRKVLGAEKNSLVKQYLGESIMMAMIAMLLAFVLALLVQPLFERVSGKTLSISLQQHAILFAGLVVLALITGFIAGLYPAFYLSSFKPIKVLKGRFTNSLAAVSLRKGMVVFQFVISIVLIIASVVIATQMKYLQNKDLGFTKDQQVIIPLRTATAKAMTATFRTEVANNPSVVSIGASMAYPGIFHPQDWSMYKEGQTMQNSRKIYINLVDDQFQQTLEMQPVAGRLFSPAFPADTLDRFVINEEAVKQFGFANAEAAVGKWMAFDWEGEQQRFTIIGVVKNFHFKDLHAAIEPFAFRMYNSTGFNYLIVHTKGNDVNSALSGLQTSWKKLNPNEPFEYSFLDLDFQKNYEADARQARLINAFTIIAIIISCLGLFALAAFSAEQRTKEIGIRKVLGASVGSVITLLSKDFLQLVLVAAIVSSPLAWYAMNKWLQNFEYRVGISWQVFVFTPLLAMVIAFVTISFQAVKAAISNPGKSLRSE